MSAGSRARRLLGNGALLVASLLVAVAGVEVGLRLFWDGFYLKEPGRYVQSSRTLGWENAPSLRHVYGEAEFSNAITHNAAGLRGPELPPPGEAFRILALGDSFTYGIGVDDDETFSARLQSRDRALQVLNAGVNGYGTSQELVLLRERGTAFAPDLVLVCFFWNDVGNSYYRRLPDFQLEGSELRYTPPDPNARLRGPRKFRRAWSRYGRHSYAYRFFSDRISLIRYRLRLALGARLESADFVDPAEREQAWKLETALLREIVRESRRLGAEVALLSIPDQVQVHTELEVVGLEADDYAVGDRVRRAADAAGMMVIDPLDDLRHAYASDGEPLYYVADRHLNARGHAIVAEVLWRELRRSGLIRELPARAAPQAR